ncbi:hypothetical protein [Pseudoduganella namucuonensis]|uniref:Uncharacterized protein n=1 Tax=Pseudoduganella namucuonensis TaxID=1035707 RepID=A0A1I7HQD3_9BURK|nr:hypothetical protein [Pseudoduganella namucuonensis]SFU62636.1 hypothetical protein SAMN05216552_100690 [Pseudoduganella namucuonensis]
MGPYTANQLSVFSAIIASSAANRNWDTATEVSDTGGELQEVQCMTFGGKLYIAGNFSEHLAVKAYLNAFGVNDEASFLKCMAYSHWLLAMPFLDRMSAAGVQYRGNYSDTATAARALAALPFTELTDDEKLKAVALLKGTAKSDADKSKGWFLRKFVGAGPLSGTAAYVKPKPKHGVGLVTTAPSPKDINVLEDSADVHAELKLLGFAFDCVGTNRGPYLNKPVCVGGLKKTCRFCAAWIDHLAGQMTKAGIEINLPTLDSRTLGSGAGKRPISIHDAKLSPYVKAMFNGGLNSLCSDLKDLKPVPVVPPPTAPTGPTGPTTPTAT